MTEVIISLLFIRYAQRLSVKKILGILTITGYSLIVSEFIVHPFWIIAKITSTPTWVFFCTGIIIIFFVLIYWLVAIKGKNNWFNIIKPSGTVTLTCYLVLYVLYSIFSLCDISFFSAILQYPVGLIKSFLVAMLAIGCTALLYKMKIKI